MGVEMVHEWTGPVTRGNMCEAHRALYVRYIRTHHYYYYYYDVTMITDYEEILFLGNNLIHVY